MFELASTPQELGEIVLQGVQLGRLAYRRLFTLSSILAFLGLIPTAVQLWGTGDDVAFDTRVPADYWTALSAWAREFYGPYGLALVVVGAVALFPQILMFRRIALAARGQTETHSAELRQALRLLPWVLLTAALYALTAGFGFCLLLVPGVILAVSLMFSVYAAVLDGCRPMAALNLSHNLVWGHWWRTLGLLLILYIPLLLLISILSSAFGLTVDPNQALHARDLFKQAVLGMVLVALFSPLILSAQYLYYHDLKLRRQNP